MSQSRGFEVIEIGITNKGEIFYTLRYHTLIAGTTGSGKTEAVRKIISEMRRQIPDLRVLIFDVKSTGRDWEGYGVDVPIYVETATDSRFLRDLIETQEERKIDWFFYELHLACEGAKTWIEVLENLKRRHQEYKEKRREIKEEKLGTLIVYMEALISELEKGDTISQFDLSNPITVVPLNFREEAFKQLVVYSYLTAMKKNRVRRILVVCDEMSSLAPSKEGTGCRKIIESYLFKQGRAAEVFGLAIDQEITGISPSVRRQCWNWILGMQTDTSAQKRTVDEIPGHNVSIDDIGTLGVGWWYGVIRTPSKTIIEKFYLIPEGLDLEIGKKIVSGEVPVEEVMAQVSDLRQKELTWKIKKQEQKAEKVVSFPGLTQAEVEKIRSTVAEIEQAFRINLSNIDKLTETVAEIQKAIKGLQDILANHIAAEQARRETRFPFTESIDHKDIQHLKAQIEKLQKEAIAPLKNQIIDLKEDFGFLEKKIEDLYAGKQTGDFELEKVIRKGKVIQTEIPFKFQTETLDGKIMSLAQEGFFDSWKRVADVEKMLTDKGWGSDRISVVGALDKLVDQQYLGKRKTDRQEYKLAPNVKWED